MSSFDWKRIQRLTVPEGRVKKVRCGGQTLWTSLYSLLETVLKAVSRPVARGRSIRAEAARADLPLTGTEALAVPARSAAAESGVPICPEPQAAADSPAASQAAAPQREELTATATALSKARSVAVSDADCMAEPAAAPLSREAAAVAFEAGHTLTALSRGGGSAAVPGGFALENDLDLTARGGSSDGRLAAVQASAHPVLRPAAAAADGAQGGCVFCPAPGFAGVLTAGPSGCAGGALSPVRIGAAVRVAESWVYPAMPSAGCICPLTRVYDAALYETRVGGNGLELR